MHAPISPIGIYLAWEAGWKQGDLREVHRAAGALEECARKDGHGIAFAFWEESSFRSRLYHANSQCIGLREGKRG